MTTVACICTENSSEFLEKHFISVIELKKTSSNYSGVNIPTHELITWLNFPIKTFLHTNWSIPSCIFHNSIDSLGHMLQRPCGFCSSSISAPFCQFIMADKFSISVSSRDTAEWNSLCAVGVWEMLPQNFSDLLSPLEWKYYIRFAKLSIFFEVHEGGNLNFVFKE